MNWRLIFSLSIYGLLMAFATVYFISSKVEPVVWLVIFLLSASEIAKNAYERFFLHGFLVSVVNTVWMTIVHILLFSDYAAKHGPEAAQYTKLSIQMGFSVTMAMIAMGVIVALVSGMILGIFSFIASKIF